MWMPPGSAVVVAVRLGRALVTVGIGRADRFPQCRDTAAVRGREEHSGPVTESRITVRVDIRNHTWWLSSRR